jgi:hypothetical protein
MKSFELYEHGNRTAALELTRLAQETAPTWTYRLAAVVLRSFLATTAPVIAARLHRLATALSGRLFRGAPSTSASGPPESALAYILTAIRQGA